MPLNNTTNSNTTETTTASWTTLLVNSLPAVTPTAAATTTTVAMINAAAQLAAQVTMAASTQQYVTSQSLDDTSGASTMATPHSVTPDPDSNDKDDLIHNEFVQIFFCILYTTVFVLGVFGNVLVCYVVLRNRAMQTVTNIFITNLALSDILLCVLAVPFTPLYTFMGRWAFGRTLCHLVSFAQGCSIYISTLTLTSIAIDRYFVIIYPFHPRMKLSTCIAIIVTIWIISLLATVPYGMYMKVVSDIPDDEQIMNSTDNANAAVINMTDTEFLMLNDVSISMPDSTSAAEAYIQLLNAGVASTPSNAEQPVEVARNYCEENWPSEQYRKVFGSLTTCLQFVLPFFIISICYVWISLKLNARARAKPGTKSSRREEADRDRKKRTNRMLICMVAVFGLSWLPLNMVNIFDDFYEKSNEWRFYTLFFFVAHSIAMSSTCYNPFLYAWLNENFRKEFKHVLPCFNPSNNNIINITRGYNRSDRNTCGPRLHHANGTDGGNGNGTGAGGAGSMEADDNDENGITQETSLPREKLLIVPREPTYGNGNTGALSPKLSCKSMNAALVHNNRQVDVLLNDCAPLQKRQQQGRQKHSTDDTDGYDDEDYDGYDDVDSCDEQTVEVRFHETPFNSSDIERGSGVGSAAIGTGAAAAVIAATTTVGVVELNAAQEMECGTYSTGGERDRMRN